MTPASSAGGTVGWYASRLRAMSVREIGARAADEVRARALPRARRRLRTIDWLAPEWRAFAEELATSAWPRVEPDAAAIARGRLCLFGREVCVDPLAPDWQRDPLTGAQWPSSWRRSGRDPKPTWELHRQQHLFALCAGARHGGRGEWADTAVAQVVHWARENPPGSGPGWSSGYEASHRLVGWALALPLVADAAPPLARARLAESYERQTRLVELRPSRSSSANNHRLAELAGLLAAACLRGDTAAFRERFGELEQEALRQTFADGGSREQAAGYFLYALEILTVAVLLARARGVPHGPLHDRLAAMLDWLAATAGAGGEPPPFGDDAEDRMLRDDYFAPRSAAALAARARAALAGAPALAAAPPFAAAEHGPALLAESGYAVLREPGAEPVRIVFDVGELGYGSLAAHGHADALSVVADAGGRTVLRDSGTGAYAPAPLRDGFRVTQAHNTVSVDGLSQAEPLGPHLWGRRYRVRVVAHRFGGGCDCVRAEHDGYAPAVHTRSVVRLDGALLVVLDRVSSPAPRDVLLTWHPDDPARLAVASSPAAAAAATEAPRSRRYGSIEHGPRLTWTARGGDVYFATAVALAGAATPAVSLHRERGATRAEVRAGERQVVVTERWNADPPDVR